MDVVAQLNRTDSIEQVGAAFIGLHLHVERADRCVILGARHFSLAEFLTLAELPKAQQ